MRRHLDADYLTTAELNKLQEIFEALLEKHTLRRDSDDADAIARALMVAYQRGVRDRVELVRLADLGPGTMQLQQP